MKKNPFKKKARDLETLLKDVRDQISEQIGDGDDDDESDDVDDE